MVRSAAAVADRTPDHRRIAAESPLPECVADDDRAGKVFVLEPAAEQWRSTEQAKHPRRHQHALGRHAFTVDHQRDWNDVGLHGLDVYRLSASAAARSHPVPTSDWRRVAARGCESRSKRAVPDSAYGSGANSTPLTTLKIALLAPMPRAERGNAGGREGGLPADAAQRVAHVLEHRFEPGQAAAIAMGLLTLEATLPSLTERAGGAPRAASCRRECCRRCA